MRKTTTSLLRLIALFGLPLLLQAQRTTHIPADVPTIQAAIDASTDGDTLLVAPGTYFENLNLRGKAITLESAEGPTVTILDGRHLASVVTFASNETRATTLSGFTLRNGAPSSETTHGAAILLISSAPTITGSILTQNQCAAVDGTNASPLLTHTIIRETEPSPRCVAQPIAPVVFTGGAPTLRNNLIEHNDLSGSQAVSAGIALLDTNATLEGNILRFNTTSNDAPSAISVEGGVAHTLLEQNLIHANRSHCGPAVSVSQPGVTLLNNTIADNLSDPVCPQTSLAAELALATPQVLLANNILASTTAHTALACAVTIAPEALHHNLLQGTAPNTCPTTSLVVDPLFADRTQSDYHLAPHSPALDEGASTLAPLPAEDLDGAPRTQAGRIDLGAYEHLVPHVLGSSSTLLNASPNPAEAFQSITLIAQVAASSTTPAGSVTFTTNTQTLATLPLDTTGRVTFTTTTLPAGNLTLTAAYAGSGTLAPSLSTQTVSIAPATTLLSFAVTPSSADETQIVTLSAIVQAPLSTQTPAGQVQFLQLNPATAPTLLATATLDAKGHATANLPAMPSGSWLIDAAYLATPNFASVSLPASSALPLTIAPRGYTLTTASPTVTIQSGHHAPVALTLRSLGTFAATLTFSCTNLPANATCTFAPASTSLTAGATVPVTLTLETDAVPGFLSLSRPAAGPMLALVFASFLAFKRRRRMSLMLCLLGGLTGCSSKYPAQVPSGTYTLQVVSQATGSTSTQMLQLTLLVTD